MTNNNHVLIIDDDEVNNYLCTRIINMCKFSDRVETRISADKGMEYLNTCLQSGEELPNVIFLDINMPLKNGWDFLNEYETVKEKFNKYIKIYMLSSSVYEEDICKAESITLVQDYISKPLSEKVLNKIKDEI